MYCTMKKNHDKRGQCSDELWYGKTRHDKLNPIVKHINGLFNRMVLCTFCIKRIIKAVCYNAFCFI